MIILILFKIVFIIILYTNECRLLIYIYIYIYIYIDDKEVYNLEVHSISDVLRLIMMIQ